MFDNFEYFYLMNGKFVFVFSNKGIEWGEKVKRVVEN